MPWIGLILSLQEEKSSWNTQKKKSNEGAQVKKALKHRTVGSANVPVGRIYKY